MPPAPELLDGSRDIRVIEALGKFKTEDFSKANGHVRISAEVKVDLEYVSNCTHPSAERGDVAGIKHSIRQRC